MMKKLAGKYVSVPHEVTYPFCNVAKFSKVTLDYKSMNLCSVATARYSKGADIMLDFFRLYKKKFPKAELFVLGKGDASSLLRKEPGVVNPDWGNPAAYFNKCGLYINLSRIEPFGVNIIEAMCAGLPVLVSKHCGAAEIVKQVDPFLVTPLDPKVVLHKAIALQKNPAKKKAIGKKAKKIVKTMTKDKSVKEFVRAFKRLQSF